RCRTTSDLIEQAGPRAIGENAVLAGTQAKYPLQDLYGFTHCPGIRIWPKIPAFAAGAATIIGNSGNLVTTEHQIGIRLVIPEQNVVARLQALDQIVLEQQGFRL